METFELANDTTITQIGTLEWKTWDGPIKADDLKGIRPTTKEDLIYEKVADGVSYSMNLSRVVDGNFDNVIANALVFLCIHVLSVLARKNVHGSVLLCFAKKQQRLDVAFVCNAYKVNSYG